MSNLSLFALTFYLGYLDYHGHHIDLPRFPGGLKFWMVSVIFALAVICCVVAQLKKMLHIGNSSFTFYCLLATANAVKTSPPNDMAWRQKMTLRTPHAARWACTNAYHESDYC